MKNFLDNREINENYARYKTLIGSVKREGADKYLAWVDGKDLKTAPASTQYNLSCAGGLVKHMLNVYDRLRTLVGVSGVNVEDDSVTLTALLFDVCKVDYYKADMKNVKLDNGSWVQQPFYRVYRPEERSFYYGSNGENAVYIAGRFFTLTLDESTAILHADGGISGNEVSTPYTTVLNAYRRVPLALLLHEAIAEATVLDEN